MIFKSNNTKYNAYVEGNTGLAELLGKEDVEKVTRTGADNDTLDKISHGVDQTLKKIKSFLKSSFAFISYLYQYRS